MRPRGWHLPERHLAGRRRAGLRRACSTSASTSSTTRGGCSSAAAGPYFYLPKLESHLEARLWNDVFDLAEDELGLAARHDPRDRADRDDPRRVRDGRDPLRAARARRRPQRRPLGLHLQRHQEVPRAAGVRAPRPRAGDDDGAVHARLHRAAREDLPPARRPRDRRDGGVHPEPPRPRGERASRSRRCARTRGARRATASTAPGSRIPTSCRWRPRSSTRCSATGRTRSTGCARTSTVGARELLDVRVPGGEVTEEGLRNNVGVGAPLPRVLARAAPGAVAIYNLMEDAATAEISRSQVWQWVRHGRVRARAGRARGRGGVERSAEVGDGTSGRAASTRRASSSSRSRSRERVRRVPDPAGLRLPGLRNDDGH